MTSDKASSADVRRILGRQDEVTMLVVLALKPTIVDLENAAMLLSGDKDVFGAGEPANEVVGEIVSLLSEDEDDEPRAPRQPA